MSAQRKRPLSLRSRLMLLFGLAVIVGVMLTVVLSYFSARRELQQELDSFLFQRVTQFQEINGQDSNKTAEDFDKEEDFIGGDIDISDDDGFSSDTDNGRNPNINRGPGSQLQSLRDLLSATPLIAPVQYDSWTQIFHSNLGLSVRLRGTAEIPLTAKDKDVAKGTTKAYFQTRSVILPGEEKSRNLRIYTAPLPDGYAVQVARDLGEVERALSDLLTRSLWFGGGFTVVIGALGWFIGWWLVKPVDKLASTAENVTQTLDLTTPVPVAGSSEVVRLATSFNHMLSALDTSRQQQQQLVADAGHELRTPLTSLRTNIELLSTGVIDDSEERLEVLGDVEAEIIELSKVIEELLELNRDPHKEEERREMSLGDVAVAVAERARRQWHRPIEVSLAKPAVVSGYELGLERAVSNLISNAVKFSPEGTPILISVDGTGLEVKDQGEGIPPQHLEKIFDRFYRAEESRSTPGSGLGLSITRQIVERHGGQVWARNDPDAGAIVGFKLPPVEATQESR